MSKKLADRLSAFIKEVAELEKVDQFEEDGFSKQFRELRSLGMAHREDNKFPAEEGKKDENIKKNRYKDILPFDATRVTLQLRPGEPGSDYINANFVKGANGKKAYIASQGPLPHTVQDFWRMLWEYNVDVVVMVCQEVEGGKSKCERYWTKNLKEEKQFGDIHVKLVEKVDVSLFFCMRKLSVWKSNQENHKKTISHFHYSGWMDHDIPHNFGDIIDLLSRMRQHQSNEDIPVVIHCSAGCGRTGTICAIDFVWNMLKEGMISENFSLYDIILDMRSQRQSMVQTPDQYKVVHLAVKQMFENRLKQMNLEQHNYENVLLEDKPVKSLQTGKPKKPKISEEVSKSAQSLTDYTVSSKQKVEAENPAVQPEKPTSIPLAKSSNLKMDGFNRKPATPDGKPLLSPKPVLDTENKLVIAHKQQQPNESYSAPPTKVTATPMSYENVSLSTNSETSPQKTGQFVTKITVGPVAGNKSEAKNMKSLGRNSQPTPVASTNNAAQLKGKGPDKSNLYLNDGRSADTGPQKTKAVAPTIPPSQGRIEKSPVSNKNSPSTQSGTVQRFEVDGSMYAVVSKSQKPSGIPDAKSISSRPPAVLPHSSKPVAVPYEDVGLGGNKEYAYAEPNATDKWKYQGMARTFEQKNQARTRPPNAYEEIDVSTQMQNSKMSTTNFSDCTYSSVDNIGEDYDQPPVPVKTPEAKCEDDEKKKNMWGVITSLPKTLGSKAEAVISKGKGREKHAKDSEPVAFNNKKIGGFGNRVKKPVGPRPVPRGWGHESSL